MLFIPFTTDTMITGFSSLNSDQSLHSGKHPLNKNQRTQDEV